jgi:membrane protease YdiL (CAAX protease family)
VSLTEGVAGLKTMGSRLIRWRVSWIWYALALAVPLAVTFAAIGLNTAFGAPVPDITEFSVWYGLPLAIAINMVNPLNAQLPEEASFRGWAQPKLQTTRTPLAATVLMAIGVTIWHLPLVVMPQFGSSPIEALATIAVTFWYAWLFNHASGSALLTLIAHATNGTIETSALWPAGADTTYGHGDPAAGHGTSHLGKGASCSRRKSSVSLGCGCVLGQGAEPAMSLLAGIHRVADIAAGRLQFGDLGVDAVDDGLHSPQF